MATGTRQTKIRGISPGELMKVPSVQLMRDAVRQGVGVSGKGAPETCGASQEILPALGRLRISDLGGRVQGGPHRSGCSRVDGREGFARIKNGGCATQAAPGLWKRFRPETGTLPKRQEARPTSASSGAQTAGREAQGLPRSWSPQGGPSWPGKAVRPDAVPV